MKRGADHWHLGFGLLLLAGVGLPGCVRSSGHPPDPTAVPKVEEEKKKPERAEEPPKENMKEEPEEPLVPKILAEETRADERKILGRVTAAEATIASLARRDLSGDQAEQVIVARSFLDQARAALAEEDLQRAAVLADKGAALAEGVEEASRE